MIPLIYHPIYSALELPAKHRYPINKYRLLYQEIVSAIQVNETWQEQLKFIKPSAIVIEQVKAVHDSDYVDALIQGNLPAAKMRRIGFPWSEALMERTLMSSGGTCKTVEMAVECGLAIHLSGGYHHAHADFGSGFCLFNDLVLAAKYALNIDNIDKVLIVDSDVHHGDGSATLTENESDIVTLSFHCEKNFPARKPNSTMDIAMPRDTNDAEFLDNFTSIVEMAINLHQPDLILYDAGVDIHIDDELGYFQVSTDGIYERDRFMFELAKRQSLPIACVIGGGYRTEHRDLVPIHMQLIKAAMDSRSQIERKSYGTD
ncbi:histone deacetylase family protein [Vibrio rumoiensis]|uniref:Histone deacetylase n=1 Tax=Vibrio rumoiensis 1S-45 TaxID=1188252 RepID=A0A1E5DZA6_9VIBR|nr:histone deacetylase [Vibrio rumoiensis]OEF23194.1 histone deacetylase [Vibrio rumoiensis 1S-45]